MQLNELQIGTKAKVVSFGNKELENAFLLFGLLPETVVQINRKVPFGGSLYLAFNQTIIAVRRTEAAQVSIELI